MWSSLSAIKRWKGADKNDELRQETDYDQALKHRNEIE